MGSYIHQTFFVLFIILLGTFFMVQAEEMQDGAVNAKPAPGFEPNDLMLSELLQEADSNELDADLDSYNPIENDAKP